VKIRDNLTRLAGLGTDTVVLDPFGGDPAETHPPEIAWRAPRA